MGIGYALGICWKRKSDEARKQDPETGLRSSDPVNEWEGPDFSRAVMTALAAQGREVKGSYNSPRNVFNIPRIAFSWRRYQRHCPFLVASTSPAFVKTAM